jgi:RNA-directed DNA polymerase
MKESKTEQGEELRRDIATGMPLRLAELRQKLRGKAKEDKKYRFYSLYGTLCQKVVLEWAWAKARANDGAPGEDGVRFEQIEKSEQGVTGYLEAILRELEGKKYRAGWVRREYIPKANGKMRPLGIPNIKDRVIQTAVVLLLEPIFEEDFKDCSHGFRPGRGCKGALEEIRETIQSGRCSVYDADLKGYFDSIPHDKLIECIRMRVVDGSIIGLIRQWLKAVVVEKGKEGKKPTIKRNDKGTPQGGVISPLLANIYLHWFDYVFHRKDGPAHWAKAKLVRYADDFVVMAQYQSKQLQGFIEKKLETWLGLELNREKTRIVNVREDGATLDFLGYSFRYEKDLKGRNWKYLRMSPSRKSVQREKDHLYEMTNQRQCHRRLDDMIKEINEHLVGWKNYFNYGHSRREFREINNYVRERLIRHLRRRSQRGWRRPQDKTAYAQLNEMGLIYL